MVPASLAVYEKAMAFWLAKSINVACELNIAEIIGTKTLSVEEIAKQSNSDPNNLYRLLRALAGEGIFKEIKPKHFNNTDLSNALIEGPGNMKHMILHQMNKQNWELVNSMKHSVQTGKSSALEVLGSYAFDHLEKYPEKNELYNKAMSDSSRMLTAALISAYPLKDVNTLLDLGGGDGSLLFNILLTYPKMKGILFDLPHVVETAPELAKRFGVQSRVSIVAGNFFENIPTNADAYLLKNILHAFDDEQCIRLMTHIYECLPPKKKILIIETVIEEDNEPAFGNFLDLQMMLGTEKGMERTREQFASILQKSGFKSGRVVKTISPFCVVEGIKE